MKDLILLGIALGLGYITYKVIDEAEKRQKKTQK